MNNKILPHEYAYLIERNLKSACDTDDAEQKKIHILRAMRLMELDAKEREENDSKPFGVPSGIRPTIG